MWKLSTSMLALAIASHFSAAAPANAQDALAEAEAFVEKAAAVAEPTMEQVRERVGLSPKPALSRP